MKHGCELCEKIFDTPADLESHKKRHKKRKVLSSDYVCQKCGKMLSSKRNLNSHLQRNVPCDYQCKICDLKFDNYDNYYYHQKSKHGEKSSTSNDTDNNNVSTSIGDNAKNSSIYNEAPSKSPQIIPKKKSKKGKVYLLQQPDNPSNVWKIGRTARTLHERISGYQKGTTASFHAEVSDCYACETAIKDEFKKKFIQRKDRGMEWFEGDGADMIELMKEIVEQFK